MTAPVELSDVVVQVGEQRILDGVSLTVASGCILAVVGPNGAGKTTLLDAISGVAPSSNGASAPIAGIGRVFQGSPLPETLTVGEIVTLAVGRDPSKDLMGLFGLSQYECRFVSELSTGMRRILDIAVATATSPKVLLLDEPASGLAQSEIENLAGIIKKWRDENDAAIVIVEHDSWLVGEVADEVAVMDAGRIVAVGEPSKVLAAVVSHTKPRLRDPADPRFKESLGRVTAGAVRSVPVSRTISTWTLMRLGLREFAAGLGSVLLLGVLNRVLKVEFGLSLGLVAAILASYNLAAPFALVLGHRSDRFPILGRRRVPYIIGGGVVAGLAMIVAPHVALNLANGLTLGRIAAAVSVFVAMGLGMWGAGTVFLALLADIVPEEERPHAISITYIMLLLGVMTGVGLTIGVIDEDGGNIGTLFAIAGLLIIVFTVIAVWGKEPPPIAGGEEAVPFLRSMRGVAKMRQARLFFAFSTLAVIFLFLQQSVLEPFGGDVLGLSIRATTTFNAVMFAGILIGMWLAGRPFSARFGHKQVARWGCVFGVVSFAALSGAALARSAPGAWFSIFAVGLASGIFTVAGLSLMMGMVDKRRTALFMGVWTIGRAVADASAVLGGGLVFEVAHRVSGTNAAGYATVFGVSALGLLLCLPLLRRLDPDEFRREAQLNGTY